jgi:hypothetical protein
MNDDKIIEMLKELTESIDFEAYSDIFYYDDRNNELKTLVEIVRKYMDE